jgi:catechol 2,3-dioxygenase-like lactoylglutathione lyase family enzyme
MFGFKGIHHIAISVPSLQEAKAFYVDKLGFTVVDEDHIPPSADGDKVTALKNADCNLMMVKAGNLFLEFFEFHHPTPTPQNSRPVCDHGYTHFASKFNNWSAACPIALISFRRRYEHPPQSGARPEFSRTSSKLV